MKNQPLPRHLKRERIIHDLPEEEKHCHVCDQDLRPIGEESSERYEYIPAQLTVTEDVCKKYACACTVRTATKAATADREEHGGRESAGAGNRREVRRPSSAAPPGTDL